jgi:hypothetical protein
MTRFVTFNGQTQGRPGGITKVNANALDPIGLATNGIVGLVGEAAGGLAVPGEVTRIDDPALAEEQFGSGDLADAIRIAFNPAKDPRITAGAFRCLCVQVNQGTQATLELRAKVPPAPGVNMQTDSVAAGSTATIITLTTGGLTPSAEVGNHLRIGSEEREITANTATTVTVSPAFSQIPPNDVPAYILMMHDYYASNVGAVYTLANGGLTVDAHIGNYLRLGTEVRLITDNAAGTVTLASDFTASATVGQALEFLAPAYDFTSKIYGVRGNRIQQEFESGSVFGAAWTNSLDGQSQISDDLGNKAYLIIEYVGQALRVIQVSGTDDGGDAGVNTISEVGAFTPAAHPGHFCYADDTGGLAVDNLRKIASNTADVLTMTENFTANPGATTIYEVRTGQVLSGTLQATSTANTCTLPAVPNVAVDTVTSRGELGGLIIAITGGTGAGQRRVIADHAAGVGATLTVDKDWETQPDATSTFEIRYCTEANATLSGAAGVSTGLTSRVAVDGAAAATDLNIAFAGEQTLQELANEINQNSNYSATIPATISPLSLVNDFDFDHSAWRVELRNDMDAEGTAPFPLVSPAIQWLNRFQKMNALIEADIDAKSEWAEVARDTGTGLHAGGGIPEFTGGSVGTAGDTFEYFSGAIRGVSTNTNWQDALDELLKVRKQHVVPLISEDLANQVHGSSATFAVVAAQLGAHVSLCRGVEKNECGGYMGIKGTRTQYVARANLFGDQDVALTSQRLTRLNAAGSASVELDEWSSAVAAAGTRAGMPEVGEPLTHKYLRSDGLDQDASWDPLDRTDANLLIENGCLFAENKEGKGMRWVRDLTTWIADDNLAYAEGSVRDAVRFFTYGLREHLEDKFTGIKAKPATAANIKEETAAFGELMRGEFVIVDSIDEDTGELIHAYHEIRVTISGDIARVRVEIFPVTGVNFQLTEIFLQLPVQAAT